MRAEELVPGTSFIHECLLLKQLFQAPKAPEAPKAKDKQVEHIITGHPEQYSVLILNLYAQTLFISLSLLNK